MLDAVRKFAQRVLLMHALLLVVVLAIVAVGAREIYLRAREHAIEETKQRQELLARQTATGIEAYYLGIITQLEKMQRMEDSATTQKSEDVLPGSADKPVDEGPGAHADAGPPPPPGTRPHRPMLQRMRERAPTALEGKNVMDKSLRVDPVLTSFMWKMLQGRVAFLFVLDPANKRVIANQAFPPEELPLMRQVAHDRADFLKDLQEPMVSSFLQLDGQRSGHLIAVPATAGTAMGDRTLVAFVPVDYVKVEFFDPLNSTMGQGAKVNAVLLDSSGYALVSLNSEMTGKNLTSEPFDPATKENFERHILNGEAGSWTVDKPLQFGSIELPPRILSAEPMTLLGKRWTVLIGSPTSATEAVIRPIFNSAILWAGFFALAVAGLLVSTSVFMIRNRLKYERARHELLSREVAQAREIQLAWLPNEHDVPVGLSVSAANLPASHISGDFYNWFELPAAEGTAEGRRRIAIVIGDVTGHGMAAAFLMATTQLLVRTTLLRYQDPGRCLEAVNKQLCTQGFRGQFVTMIVMILDPQTSSIEVATAGHPAPLVARNGKFEALALEPQLVLGVDPQEQYRAEGFVIEPGGTLMLYTDGVVEAERQGGEQYGLERLARAASARESMPANPQQRISDVLEDVKRFCGAEELHDDVTLVAIRAVGVTAEVVA